MQEDRFRIETLLQEQHTLRAISRIMVIDVSVISRECKRNRGKDGSYCAISAQKQADLRRSLSTRGTRKIEYDLVWEKTLRMLCEAMTHAATGRRR